MNTKEQMDLVREHIRAFSTKNWKDYKDTLAPGCVYVELATHRRIEGPEPIVKALETWTRAFPDLEGKILNLYVQNEFAVAEIRWEGTHKGALKLPFGEIPPSNKKGTVEAVEVLVFRGNKIAEARHYFDVMTILEQIGMPLPQLAPVAF